MPVLTAMTWVWAVLVVVAGARKLARPAATRAALQGARMPADPRLVRLLGAAEAVAGLAVLLWGRPPAMAAMAALFAAFAGFAEHQRRAGASCGCFGAGTAPATVLHVGVNVAAALTAGAAAVGPTAPLPALVAAAPATGLLTAWLVAVAASALVLLLTDAPALAAAVAEVTPGGDA